MTSPAERRGPARIAHGGLAAFSATAVALLSHLAGGGQMPGWLGIVVPLALSLPVCTALAGRQLSLLRLSASVAVSQLLFHLLFVLGTTSGSAPASAGMHGHGVHGQGALPTAPPMEMVHGGPTMWVWHGIAAVVTVALLHRGELTLARLRELAVGLAVRALPRWVESPFLPVPPVRARTVATVVNARPTHPAPQLSAVLRRGPPLLLAV